jgi:hypothetical protein
VVFYQEGCRYWLKALAGLPFFVRNGQEVQPPHERVFSAMNDNAAALASCSQFTSHFDDLRNSGAIF